MSDATPTPLERVVAQLRRSRKILMGTHASPDGDALGSELALARFLKGLGKEVRILNTGGLARRLAWLPAPGEVEDYAPARHDAAIAEADAIVVVDIGNWERLETMVAPVMKSRAVRIDLDHHPVENCPADLSVNDPSAPAVGMIVYRLIRALGGRLTRETAEPIYVSLLTDTGSFKYSNTGPDTHRLAAECLALGVEPYTVYTRLYECMSPARLRLLGTALARVEVDRAVAWTVLPHGLYAATGAREDDSEGIVEQVRALEGVETALVFKEAEPGVVKVSLRSKSRADVNAVARRFGGGGHARAAGLTMRASLEKAVAEVLAAAREETARAGAMG